MREIERERPPLPRDSAVRGKAAHPAPLRTDKFPRLAGDFSPFPVTGESWRGEHGQKNPNFLRRAAALPSPLRGEGLLPSHEGPAHPAAGHPGAQPPAPLAAPLSRTCRLARPEIGHSHPPTHTHPSPAAEGRREPAPSPAPASPLLLAFLCSPSWAQQLLLFLRIHMARPCWESRLPALPALSGPRQCGAEARREGKRGGVWRRKAAAAAAEGSVSSSSSFSSPRAGDLGAVGAAGQGEGGRPGRDGSRRGELARLFPLRAGGEDGAPARPQPATRLGGNRRVRGRLAAPPPNSPQRRPAPSQAPASPCSGQRPPRGVGERGFPVGRGVEEGG